MAPEHTLPETDVTTTLPLSIDELIEGGLLPESFKQGDSSSFLAQLGTQTAEKTDYITQREAFKQSSEFYRKQGSNTGELLRVNTGDTKNRHFYVVPAKSVRGAKPRGQIYSEFNHALYAIEHAGVDGYPRLISGQEIILPNGRGATFNGNIQQLIAALTQTDDKNMYNFRQNEQLGFDRVPLQVNFRPYGDKNYQALAALRLVEGNKTIAFPFSGNYIADLILYAALNTDNSIIATANFAVPSINRAHSNFIQLPSQSMITRSLLRQRRLDPDGAIIGLNHGQGWNSHITVLPDVRKAIEYSIYLEALGYKALVGTTQGHTFVAPRRPGIPQVFKLFGACGDDKALFIRPGYEQNHVFFDDGNTDYSRAKEGVIRRHGIDFSADAVHEELASGLNSVLVPIEEQRKLYSNFASNFQIPAILQRILNAPKVTPEVIEQSRKHHETTRKLYPGFAQQTVSAVVGATV